MAAPVLRLPRCTQSYPTRVGPITFRFPHYLWASPSAKAGAGSSSPGRDRGGAAPWSGTSPRRYPSLSRGQAHIASTCSPAQAAPVCVLQEAMIFAVVTFLLPKNRPAPSSPPRSPPSRLRHTVLRASICSRTAPPFCRGAHPRMSQVTCPWRLLGVRCRDTLKPIRPASGQSHSDSKITCAHALISVEAWREFAQRIST